MELTPARLAASLIALALSYLCVRHRRALFTGARTYVELIAALWRGPRWWLVPVVFFFIPAVLVLVLLESVPVVAPFVYTVF